MEIKFIHYFLIGGIMSKNLEIIESKDSLILKDSNNTLAEIYLNEFMSKEDAQSFLKEIKKHINQKQGNSIQEKMKKVDQEMQKCNYDLEELYKLYESKEDKFEKGLIYAEIRSIEILNTIKIESKD